MMKIAITGSSGYLGKKLCAQLEKEHFNVLKITRSGPSASITNIDKDTDWSFLKDSHTVVHLAAKVHDAKATRDECHSINFEGTANLASQCEKLGIKRFIFISTVAVYGEESLHIITEKKASLALSPYAKSKLDAEVFLKDKFENSQMEIITLQLPMVYGKNAPGNFSKLAKILKLGLPLPLGGIHNKKSFLFIGNFVNGLLKIIQSNQRLSGVYLLTDDTPMSTSQLLKLMKKAGSYKSLLIPIPTFLLKLIGLLTGKSQEIAKMTANLEIDNSKFKTNFDWSPPFSNEEAMDDIFSEKKSALRNA